MVITEEIHLQTKGYTDIIDVTPRVRDLLEESGLRAGTVTVFCPGSTGGVTTIEYESGVVQDLQEILEEIIPVGRDYRHHQRWGDDNGSSHIRSALVGPSFTVPFTDGTLTLGTWQQIVFIDFDTRARSRRLVVQIVGE
jgi:secondary thiamine-phosphate synthase enzyme